MKYNIKYRWQKRLLVLALAGFLSAHKGEVMPSFSAGEWIVADAAQNSLSKTEITISKGERSALTVKGSYKKVTWSVDDKKVATVTENGVVEGVSAGSTVVRAMVDKTEYKCRVTVEAPRLNQTKLTARVGNTYQLSVSGTERKVTYKSSDSSVVKVSSKGKLSFLKPGSAKVTATIGGMKLTCTVRVSTPSIVLPRMESGQKGAVDLSGKKYKGISFASSNPSVVSVDKNGNLQANAPGSAQITVKIADYEYVGQIKVGNSLLAAAKYGIYDGLAKQDEKIARKAHEVLELTVTDEMEEIEKIRAIHDYIVLNTAYDTTYTRFSIANTLFDGSAVCQGYAETMKLFLDVLGMKNQLIYGTSNGESHVWNLVYLEDAWYHLDVTWDDPVDQVTGKDMPGYVRHTYFMLKDEVMAKDHIWKHGDYPEASGGRYEDYVVKKQVEQFVEDGLFAQTQEEFVQLAVECALKEKYEVTILYAGDASAFGNLIQTTANALSRETGKSSEITSRTQQLGEYLQVTLEMKLY